MSEKKIYQVDVELSFSMAVFAENEAEARQVADENYEEELSNVYRPDLDLHPYVMTNPKQFEGTLPYGSDDDSKTVEMYFDAPQAPARRVRPAGLTFKEEEIIRHLRAQNKLPPKTPE